MAQSPEYPDLPWMPPKSWEDANRGSVQLIVIHTTEGAARAQAAEDGAAYDQRRTDGVSTHYFHDAGATVQCVHSADVAHTARTQGNRRGVHHELCTKAGSANWGDVYHQQMLGRAARQAARDATKWGIPVRHLTAAQVAAGEKGFCGHVDITRAFPQDRGTHTDPGPDFPWTQFLDLVRAELEDIPVSLTADDKAWITGLLAPLKSTDAAVNPIAKLQIPDFNQPEATRRKLPLATWIGYIDVNRNTDRAAIVTALTQALAARPDVDTDALVAALAPALADAVVAKLPTDVDDVTTAELRDAFVGALTELVNRPPAA